MEKLMQKFLRSSLITSIVLIVLGLLLVFESEATIFTISYVIGGILIALGVLAIMNFIKSAESMDDKYNLNIIYGVVTVILGILIITNPQAIASVIPIVIGLGIIISSCTKLQYAFQLKANENELWKTTMVISVISTICGIVLLFNPFEAAVGITRIVGIFIVVYAVLDIISTIAIKNNVKKFHQVIEQTIEDAEIIEEESVVEVENKKDAKAKKKTKKSSKKK